MTIKYLHFCGGFGNESGKPLRFWERIAIDVAARLHPTATLMLHTSLGSWNNAPTNSVIKYYTEDESSQYSTWRCKHGAHQSDKVRLMALLKYGGLYQDTDSFMLRNCDHLTSLSTPAMPLQNRVSLANGFMYSPSPGDPWLTEAYRRVDCLGSSRGWDGSSVRLYTKLHREMPYGCTALKCSEYLASSTQSKDVGFFFSTLDASKQGRIDNCYVAHAIETSLNYKDKIRLMDSPPPGSVYSYVLEKCQTLLNRP